MVYLKMKCPHCYTFLMDKDKLIDNKPSLKLKIKYRDKEGFIWLSGVYGSYKHQEDFEIPKNETAEFFCPECNKPLIAESECDECNAIMVPLLLEEGGRVRFCSRSGCVNHSIEFKRPEVALKLLYDAYSYDNYPHSEMITHTESAKSKNEKDRKEIMKNGTFLFTYCPHCQKSLIKDNEIELEIINENNETGILHLSPYLNVFKHRTTIRLQEGNKVKDIICPHCKHTLIEEKECPECGFNIVRILVTSSIKLVEFFFCSKPGCKWHGISEQDEEIIRIEDSKEW